MSNCVRTATFQCPHKIASAFDMRFVCKVSVDLDVGGEVQEDRSPEQLRVIAEICSVPMQQSLQHLHMHCLLNDCC